MCKTITFQECMIAKLSNHIAVNMKLRLDTKFMQKEAELKNPLISDPHFDIKKPESAFRGTAFT